MAGLCLAIERAALDFQRAALSGFNAFRRFCCCSYGDCVIEHAAGNLCRSAVAHVNRSIGAASDDSLAACNSDCNSVFGCALDSACVFALDGHIAALDDLQCVSVGVGQCVLAQIKGDRLVDLDGVSCLGEAVVLLQRNGVACLGICHSILQAAVVGHYFPCRQCCCNIFRLAHSVNRCACRCLVRGVALGQNNIVVLFRCCGVVLHVNIIGAAVQDHVCSFSAAQLLHRVITDVQLDSALNCFHSADAIAVLDRALGHGHLAATLVGQSAQREAVQIQADSVGVCLRNCYCLLRIALQRYSNLACSFHCCRCVYRCLRLGIGVGGFHAVLRVAQDCDYLRGVQNGVVGSIIHLNLGNSPLVLIVRGNVGLRQLGNELRCLVSSIVGLHQNGAGVCALHGGVAHHGHGLVACDSNGSGDGGVCDGHVVGSVNAVHAAALDAGRAVALHCNAAGYCRIIDRYRAVVY